MTASYQIIQPKLQSGPVMFASPHSGRAYPPAFLAQSGLDLQALRSSEDAFVDDLVAAAPRFGAPLLLAHVPRAYVDLNRGPDEFDPAVIDGVRINAHNPRVTSGLGVIPRVVAGGRAIHREKISQSEAQIRIALHWHPYHRALRQMIHDSGVKFGAAVLLDMHSMPSEAAQNPKWGTSQPDIVLGDRHGTAASADITGEIESAFTAHGLRVARNSPFAGAYIAQHYGRPALNRHVVQIEINRGLYMNEAQITPLPQFDDVCAMMTSVIARLVQSLPPTQALAAE